MSEPLETMSISTFKATCLAVLERVRRTRKPILITRRGEPVAEVVPPPAPEHRAGWLGVMEGTGSIAGDIVGPVVPADDWDTLQG